mmetsp:Transcript_73624/g.221323  ORF Transcript_73624/g.221323 Transcript_73624/m.221323 type:complete len:480 (+) Transcript_73624:138-1577(+)
MFHTTCSLSSASSKGEEKGQKGSPRARRLPGTRARYARHAGALHARHTHTPCARAARRRPCALAWRRLTWPSGGSLAVGELAADLVERLLGVAEQHVGVVLEEDGVLGSRVASAHRTLHHDDLIGLPHLQHGHARDDGRRVLLGGGVDGVVGADDECEVGALKVVVDLLHLEHVVVRHARLREQHVELARHAAGDRVDAEAHVDALLPQLLGDLGDGVLAVGDGEAVAGDDDHVFGALHQLDGGVDVGEGGVGHLDQGARGGRGDGGGGAIASEQDGADLAVHGDAHDVGEDGAGGADEGADRREHRLVEHEALGAEGPAGGRVEARDDDGHIGAADGLGDVGAEEGGGGDAVEEELETERCGGVGDEGGGGGGVEREQAAVDQVAAGEGRGSSGDEALQLAKGDERARDGDAAEKGGGVDGGGGDWRHGVVRGGGGAAQQELADRGGDRSETHEGVEACDRLRQLGGADLAGDAKTNR